MNHLSNRIISTPSTYAKNHYLYVQETGTLQSLEPHISSRKMLGSLLFILVKKGTGTISIKNKSYEVKEKDCIFINCEDAYSHESSIENPWELSWVHFYGIEASNLYKHFLDLGGNPVFTPEDTNSFSNNLYQLFTELSNKGTLYELKCHNLLTMLITDCFSSSIEGPHLASNVTSNEASNDMKEKLVSIHAYLDNHFSEIITLEYLSEHFFISKYHMSREYKKKYGITIINYLNSKRISEAKSLLRFSNNSIVDIANTCGIPDENYFTKVFYKYESMTPTEYRKKWR